MKVKMVLVLNNDGFNETEEFENAIKDVFCDYMDEGYVVSCEEIK